MQQFHPMQQAFIRVHGPFVTIPNVGHVFADGAVMSINQASGGVNIEPSGDVYTRQHVIVAFWSAKLKLAEDEFEKRRKGIHAKAVDAKRTGQPSPSDNDVAHLEGLRKRVLLYRSTLAAARVEVKRLTPEPDRAKLAEREANMALADSIMGRINRCRV